MEDVVCSAPLVEKTWELARVWRMFYGQKMKRDKRNKSRRHITVSSRIILGPQVGLNGLFSAVLMH